MSSSSDRDHTDLLHFRFKGNRNYVHGPDIYLEVARRIQDIARNEPINSFRITFHRRITHHCQLFLRPVVEGIVKPCNAVTEFFVSIGSVPMFGWLHPTDEQITNHYNYAESTILDQCEVGKNTVSTNANFEFSSIEVIVAMTRKMHESLFPEAEGKWIVSRLDSQQMLPAFPTPPLTVKLKQNIGNRLTRSEILFGTNSVGNIFFSLAK